MHTTSTAHIEDDEQTEEKDIVGKATVYYSATNELCINRKYDASSGSKSTGSPGTTMGCAKRREWDKA